jgi:hypothetical protein
MLDEAPLTGGRLECRFEASYTEVTDARAKGGAGVG